MQMCALLLLPLVTGMLAAAEAPDEPALVRAQPTGESKPQTPAVPASSPKPGNAAPAPAQGKVLNTDHSKRPESSSVSARILDAIDQKFPFVPKPGTATVGTPPSRPAGDVVVLPPVTVTDSVDRMSRAIEETFRKEKAEEFNWSDGGRIYRNIGKRVTVDMNIQFHPEWGKHGGWSFLSISR